MNRYNNYHKHDHISSIITPDSNAHILDYINRAKELGETNVFTTNHGSGGDIFEARSLCDINNMNCKFGLEGYIVANSLEKDNRNYHIILIPRTNVARKKLNKANSRANKEGYYYKPRLFLDDLLNNFDSNELYITTACCAGILRDDDSIRDIFYPLYEKYSKNLMLEVQTHNQDIQKIINEKCVKYSKELGLYLVGANDSHYIYPNQYTERLELLKGKGITYADEDVFILDYPDYDTMCNRFLEQGILSRSQIIDCIDQTLIFDQCENIDIDKKIKMPTIYPNLNDDEKIQELKNIINIEFPKIMKVDDIPKNKIKDYILEVRKEMQVIEDTKEVHMSDYFLLNYNLTQLAVNKYNGVLTRSGRGSCGSFIMNKILGITQIDRLNVRLPIYSERFISTSRILENNSMADIDFNVAEQEPFVNASKELLGDLGCYPMIAYGTMKESEAFRNICRSSGLQFSEFNEVGKNIDNYRNDDKWKPYIDEAQKYIGTIISASVHPCAHILLNGDIEEEIGVIKIGDFLCAMITSNEADDWKYLKNDYLIVTVWDIISKVFKMIDKPIMTLKELLESLDDRVWDLFKIGMTCTLNQVDGDWATHMLKIYQPKSLEDLSKFTGAIRPSFESFRDDFINRKPYSTGSKELDDLFRLTDSRIIFQENLMQYFEWLGISPSESIGLIKKISKKKIKQSDFDKLTDTLRDNWIKKIGNDNQFYEMWDKMQSMMAYSFNAPHGEATAIDCLYCAYLKVNYPLEYYTVVLNIYSANNDKTNRLLDEMKYFNLELSKPKFRHSLSTYTCDPNTNTIYKGLASIKDIGKNNGNELYSLKDNQYTSFFDLLSDIKTHTSVNSKQLDILIKLDFFNEFGDINALLYQVDIYTKFHDSKVLTKSKLTPFELSCAMECCGKETEKQLRELDNNKLLSLLMNVDIPQSTTLDKMKYQVQLLGYTDIIEPSENDELYIVENIEINQYGTPWIVLYHICDGISETLKVNKKYYKEYPCEVGDILRCSFREQNKRIKVDDKWIESDEIEKILKVYSVQ